MKVYNIVSFVKSVGREGDKQLVKDQRENEISRYIEFVRLYLEWLCNVSERSLEQEKQFETYHAINNRQLKQCSVPR